VVVVGAKVVYVVVIVDVVVIVVAFDVVVVVEELVMWLMGCCGSLKEALVKKD
jgi:hypothetical protein